MHHSGVPVRGSLQISVGSRTTPEITTTPDLWSHPGKVWALFTLSFRAQLAALPTPMTSTTRPMPTVLECPPLPTARFIASASHQPIRRSRTTRIRCLSEISPPKVPAASCGRAPHSCTTNAASRRPLFMATLLSSWSVPVKRTKVATTSLRPRWVSQTVKNMPHSVDAINAMMA